MACLLQFVLSSDLHGLPPIALGVAAVRVPLADGLVMPNLLHFAVIVDRANWLSTELGMFTVARDHYLLAAEMAREAGMFVLEDAQLHEAAECEALIQKEWRS